MARTPRTAASPDAYRETKASSSGDPPDAAGRGPYAGLKARRQKAQQQRDSFQPLLDEAFDYAIPYRKPTATTGTGEKRVNRIFDMTAVISAFRFAGRLQQDLVGENFFVLAPGPLVKATQPKEAIEALAKQLEKVTSVAQAVFTDGEWDQAFHEMALDLGASTGAMLITQGDSRDKPATFTATPIGEVLLEGGPRITGVFWTCGWTIRAIKDEWPDAALGKDLEEAWKKNPETDVALNQDAVWNPKKRRWQMTVWCDKCPSPIHEAESRTCPWITPRYFRVPGEVYGRGPIMLAMPTIKTLNAAQRIQLQAATIAMLGIYTVIDDGVFNFDLTTIEPGGFWKVARNGGPMGPSVSRFPDPRIDLSQLVLNDLRMGVQAAMMDQSLPPEGAAVRSATEILERVKRLAADHLGAFGRLVREIVVPAVQRVLELCYTAMILPENITIDQLLVEVKVLSPIAMAREAERIQKIVQWLEMVLAIDPNQADEIAHIPEALAAVGIALGVPSEFIVGTEERAQIREQKQQQQMLAAAAATAANALDKAAGGALQQAGMVQ